MNDHSAVEQPGLKDIPDVSVVRLGPQEGSEDWGDEEILGMICHDLRAPLNGLQGFLDLLADTSLNHQQREFLDTARECATDLKDMMEGLLECLRDGKEGNLSFRSDPCEPGGILQPVCESFQMQAERHGLDFRYEAAPELFLPWRVDRVKLRQILGNLLSNAVKFTTEGSILVVATAMASPEGLRIEVSDSGGGIAKAQLAGVFQAFNRGDASRAKRVSGTGLGLTIVRKLVFSMGGCIELRSSEGRGTTVIVELPCERIL